MECRLAEILIP